MLSKNLGSCLGKGTVRVHTGMSPMSLVRRRKSRSRQRSWLGLLAALCALARPSPAAATDLFYKLMSPNFGGTNGIALTMAQQAQSLKAANAAAAAKAAAALGTSSGGSQNSTNQAFINAIISQLTGLVAYKVANTIAGAAPGSAGTIQSGGTTITYINQDGQLSVTLTSESGSTTLSIPTGD